MYVALILAMSIIASVFLQLGLVKLCRTIHDDMVSQFFARTKEKHSEMGTIQKYLIVSMECEKYSLGIKRVLGKGLLIALLLNVFLLVVLTVILIMGD